MNSGNGPKGRALQGAVGRSSDPTPRPTTRAPEGAREGGTVATSTSTSGPAQGVGRAPSLTALLEAGGPYVPDETRDGIRAARRTWAAFVRAEGYATVPSILGRTGKMSHDVEGVALGIILRAGALSGYELCLWRTPGCSLACVLETSFRGRDKGVQRGRDVRTRFLALHPAAFVTLVAYELRRAVAKYGRVAFRPNVASDVRWERVAPALFAIPGVDAYDYSKGPRTARDYGRDDYRVVYSVSELPGSDAMALRILRDGGTAAVVFATPKGAELPATWHGFRVIDGDLSDDRSRDPRGVVVGLRAKAAAKTTRARGAQSFGGFVREAVAS